MEERALVKAAFQPFVDQEEARMLRNVRAMLGPEEARVGADGGVGGFT